MPSVPLFGLLKHWQDVRRTKKPMKNPNNKISNNTVINAAATDAFFTDEVNSKQEARTLALEVITHLLIWMSEGTTLEQRGLRATVVLYCIRPDLIEGITLGKIGEQAGCTRQTVHKLAEDFRNNMGLVS